jgi:transposase
MATPGSPELPFELPDGTELVATEPHSLDGRLIVRLRSTVPAAADCPYCGEPRSKNGTRLIRFRDVPVQGHSVFIYWMRQKFICRACRRSSHDGHPAFDQRRNMTVRFINWISENAKRKTFKALSKDAGTNDTLVRNAFHTGENDSGPDIASLSDVIAIELIELAGRLRPAIIDVKNKLVFDVFASVEKLEEFFKRSSKDTDFDTIQLLITDIALAIPEAIMKNAVRVISRSSVEREGTGIIVNLCEQSFSKLQPIEGLSTRLARALFIRRRESLKRSARLRLDSWERRLEELYDAYGLKERFLKIWDDADKERFLEIWDSEKVEKGWLAWKNDALDYRKLDFGPVVHLIGARWDEIRNYYRHEPLSGFASDLKKIVAIDEDRKTHSFAASRAALLTKGQNAKIRS